MKKTSEQIKKELDELQKASEQLMKYLCDNHHPHVTAIVTGTGVELVEGLMTFKDDKFVND